MSSFQAQYGLRLSRELDGMSWDEFRDLLTGLGPDTPLLRVVAIRSEEDREILKQFTPSQKKLRMEWRKRRAQQRPASETGQFLNQIQAVFARMAGGEKL